MGLITEERAATLVKKRLVMSEDSAFDVDTAAREVTERGFTIISRLLTPAALTRVFAQINAVFDVALDSIGRGDMKRLDAGEKYLFLQDNAPALKSHCYDILGMLESVRTVAVDPRLIELGQRLFKTPVVPDLTQVRIDAPDNKVMQPVHQELGQLSLTNMTLWMPLVDLDEVMGGLLVVEGSNRRGLRRHVKLDHPAMNKKVSALAEEEYLNDTMTRLEMRAGDGLVFHPHLFHASAPNLGKRIRWTIVSRYNDLNRLQYIRDPNAPKYCPEDLRG
jgi:hypothetical protein